MPDNAPKRDERTARDESLALPNAHVEGQPPLPSAMPNSDSEAQVDSQANFIFDQKVKLYGEALKEELTKNTKRNFRGEYQWEPYQINVDHIPSEYHERVAHYLLQAYQLPEAERHVAYNVPVFHELDRAGMARALVARGEPGVRALAENLYNFKGADERFLWEQLKGSAYASPSSEWIAKVDFFSSISHGVIIHELLQRNVEEMRCVAENFQRFSLTEDEHRAMVEQVLEACRDRQKFIIESLVSILHKMKGVDCVFVMLEAVKSGCAGAMAVAAYLHRHRDLPYGLLSQACIDAQNDRRWRGLEDPERIEILTQYFVDYPSLNEEERAKRVLSLDPVHVLKHIDEYPSIRHLDVALFCLSHTFKPIDNFPSPSDYLASLATRTFGRGLRVDFFSYMDKLSLTLEEKLALAEAVMDSAFGCSSVLYYFEKFEGLDPKVVAEKILERQPLSFLQEGKFLGFTPSEIFLRLLQRGLLEDDGRDPRGFFEDVDAQIIRWIRCGGHGREIAAELIKAGEGRLIMENLQCFVGLTDADLREAALQAAFRGVHQGLVDTAREHIVAHQVPVQQLNQLLLEWLRVDISSGASSPEALLRIAGVAAWSLYYPTILETAEIATFLEPYRELFGTRDPEQLERNARQRFLENLVSRGVPILIQRGYFRTSTVQSLATILPSFLESTTGSHTAWTAHEANLRFDTQDWHLRRQRAKLALRRAQRELGIAANAESIQKRADATCEALSKEEWVKKCERLATRQVLKETLKFGRPEAISLVLKSHLI